MKKIYVFGVYTSDSSYIKGFAVDRLVEFDGVTQLSVVANHLSTSEPRCKHDMGITSDWKHDIYNKVYPDGYELVWLGCFDDCTDVYNLVINKFQKELSN